MTTYTSQLQYLQYVVVVGCSWYSVLVVVLMLSISINLLGGKKKPTIVVSVAREDKQTQYVYTPNTPPSPTILYSSLLLFVVPQW